MDGWKMRFPFEMAYFQGRTVQELAQKKIAQHHNLDVPVSHHAS